MREWKKRCWGLGLVVFAVLMVSLSGCKPDYPNCETDDHCADSDEGQAEGRLFCVNGLCQQCREDVDCGDESLECNAGVCEEIPGYCTSTADCPGNERCRENRCGPECLSDDDCSADQLCEGGSCVDKPECSTDADCESGEMCQNGECVDQPETSCNLEPVYFSYDSSSLSSQARNTLSDNADCIKEQNMSVRIEGHTDERGTSEYNLGLGERRANSVRRYLSNLGVSGLSTVSYGEERLERRCGEQGADSCHRQNRRVEFSER